jgi:hypothetical protein
LIHRESDARPAADAADPAIAPSPWPWPKPPARSLGSTRAYRPSAANRAFLYRVRLDAVRRQAAVDGRLIAAFLEGLRLRMDPGRRSRRSSPRVRRAGARHRGRSPAVESGDARSETLAGRNAPVINVAWQCGSVGCRQNGGRAPRSYNWRSADWFPHNAGELIKVARERDYAEAGVVVHLCHHQRTCHDHAIGGLSHAGYSHQRPREVVGNYFDSGGEHGFIDDHGTFATLSAPGAVRTIADGINNSGEVAGSYLEDGEYYGYVYDNGTLTTPDPPGATCTSVETVNSRGEVAGNDFDSNSNAYGFGYDNGTFTTLNVPGARSTNVTSINDRGEVTGSYVDNSGQHAFVYDNDTFTTLNAPGASTTLAEAVGSRGDVVGFYFDSGGEHGFVCDNGTFTALNVPGAASTFAEAVNNRDEVAGDYIDASGNTHGFVYDDGTYATLTAPGATNTYAYGINDRGEIAGTYYDSSGEHGFLASPERGEATAAGFGGAADGARARRRDERLSAGCPGHQWQTTAFRTRLGHDGSNARRRCALSVV